MIQSSTSIPGHVCPGHVCIEPPRASKVLHSLTLFLIRRRIMLSAILFTALVTQDVVLGYKPHDLTNLRDPVSVVGVLLILSGLAIRSWAVGILRKDAELTMTGPYRLIRNPLYLGSFMMMFGFCGLIDDPKNLCVILGPILLIYILKVRQEERLLSQRFPAQWPEYASSTPRFLPRIARANLTANWSVKHWMHSREYHAVAAVMVALVMIKAWQVI